MVARFPRPASSVIRPNSITQIQIGPNSVDNDAIQDAAVHGAQINDGSVTQGKIGSDAVTLSKIAAGTANSLLGYNSNGDPAVVTAGVNITISGNVISASGNFSTNWGSIGGTIGNQADLATELTNAKARANHTGTQLLSTISNAGALAALNTVAAAQIDANAVTATKILDGAVTANKIPNSSIALAKLANGSANTIVGFGGAGIPLGFTAGSNITISGGQISAASAPVASVNGNTGTVVLAAADVGAATSAQGALADSAIQQGDPINMAGATLTAAKIKRHTEDLADISLNAGTLTVDCATGNVAVITLNQNVTTFTLNNIPSGSYTLVLRLKQDATGSRTMNWPASFLWRPTDQTLLSTAANAIDVIMLWTTDGGTTYLPFLNRGFPSS